MLKITIDPIECWDEKAERFYYSLDKPYTLQLEHSLLSLSKFEEITCKGLLNRGGEPLSVSETRLYVKCMTINKNVPDAVYDNLTNEHINLVKDYIEKQHTATTVVKKPRRRNAPRKQEGITSELIYCWMVQLEIPFSCEKWNLSRLLKLIEVCNAEQQEPDMMKPKDIMKRNRAINARNKARFSKGRH